MKKIFLFALLFICLKGFSQYPAKQTLGTDSTEVNPKGALKSRLINFVFTDTTQANTQRIRQYPGAQIFTSSDNKLWLRNSTATAWILQGGGSVLSSFDTTTIYQTINDISIYLSDTSFTNQFMLAGVLLDTTYFVTGTDDSVRAYVYTDSTVIYDTLGRSLISSITNNITNILQIIDSARSDTSFYISTILNGDTLLKVRHDPNGRNDTIYFTMVASNPTRDGYMPKEAWSLFNNGQDGIISGGRVTWLTLYTYNVSEAWYRIDSVIYHSPSTDITLDAADPTDDRIDLFLLTTSNTAVNLTGTAGSGIPPDFDANLNIEVSFALVTANTTAPVTIVNKWIYQENLGTAGGEFNLTSSTARINLNSTSLPDLGSKVIEGTNVQTNDYFIATGPSGFTMTPYNVLSFRIRSKGNFGNNKKIVIRPASSSSSTGQNVTIGSGSYGFVSTNTTTYQTLTIPLSHFGTMTNPISFRFTQSNTGGGTAGWRIDNIQLQNTTTTGAAIDIYDLTKNAGNDSFYFWKNGNVIRRLKDSVGSGGSGGGISEVVAGYGLTSVNDSTLKADTLLLSTRAWRNKGIDSVVALIPAQFNPIAGTNVTITGTYPNMTFNSSGGGGGGIDSVANPNGTDSLNNYSSGTPTLGARIQRVFNVKAYGAKGDGRIIEDAVISSGSSTLTSATAVFTAGDVGKHIQIQAGGTGGYAKVFTITGFTNSTTVTLSTTAGAAVVNGVAKYGTDDQAAIQAAVAADSAAGGGTVYFPSGIYIVAGALNTNTNSQIALPVIGNSHSYDGSLMHITFKGETSGFFGTTVFVVTVPAHTGSTILSFGIGSGSFPSVIGAGLNNSTTATGVDLTIEDLNIQVMGNTPTGAAIGGINAGQMVNFSHNRINMEVDVPVINSILPTNNYAGIIYPQSGLGANIYGENTIVSGFRFGYIGSQHTVGNDLVALGCYYGFNQCQSNGARSFINATLVACVYSIASVINYPSSVSLGASLGLLEMDAEIEAVDNVAKWYNYVAAVKDTANLLTGHLGYTMFFNALSSSSFSKTGGANLQCIAIDNPIATLKDANIFTGANTYSTTFSAGAIPYTGSGAGNVLRASTTRMMYDSTNDRVGLGTASPAYDLDITKASTGNIVAQVKNTTAIGKAFVLATADSVSTWLSAYGSTSAGSLAKLGSILSSRDLRISASGLVDGGGTGKITLSPGGYNANLFTFNHLGRALINTSTDDGVNTLQVNGSSLLPTINGGASSAGNITINSTTHATKGTVYLNGSSIDAGTGTITGGTHSATRRFTLNLSSQSGFDAADLIVPGGSGSAGVFRVAQASIYGTNDIFFQVLTKTTAGLTVLESQNGAGLVLNAGNDAANSTSPIIFSTNRTEKGRMASTGALKFNFYTAGTATFDGSGNITSVSDRRAKRSIKQFTYGLDAIMKLRTSTFIYNQDSTNTRMSGFIAQDVQKAIPIAVHKGKDGMLSLETNAIIAALVNGMQEQQRQIEELKREVKNLKSKK